MKQNFIIFSGGISFLVASNFCKCFHKKKEKTFEKLQGLFIRVKS